MDKIAPMAMQGNVFPPKFGSETQQNGKVVKSHQPNRKNFSTEAVKSGFAGDWTPNWRNANSNFGYSNLPEPSQPTFFNALTKKRKREYFLFLWPFSQHYDDKRADDCNENE